MSVSPEALATKQREQRHATRAAEIGMCDGRPNYVCFFFSSRRRHTRYWRDWSSDVCSADLTTFWTVTFPLIFPGILAAALLAFVLSIDDYVITTFNAGGTITLPL